MGKKPDIDEHKADYENSLLSLKCADSAIKSMWN